VLQKRLGDRWIRCQMPCKRSILGGTYQSFLDLVNKALSIVDSASKLLDTGLEKWRTHQKVAIGKDLFKVYFFAGRAEIR